MFSSESRKLCKKLKVTPNPVQLKHYKDGEFHKDYDRQLTVSSMVNFLRDPTGDLPWEEDPSGADVVHLNDPEVNSTSTQIIFNIIFYILKFIFSLFWNSWNGNLVRF